MSPVSFTTRDYSISLEYAVEITVDEGGRACSCKGQTSPARVTQTSVLNRACVLRMWVVLQRKRVTGTHYPGFARFLKPQRSKIGPFVSQLSVPTDGLNRRPWCLVSHSLGLFLRVLRTKWLTRQQRMVICSPSANVVKL